MNTVGIAKGTTNTAKVAAKALELPARPSRILVAEDEHLVAAELTAQLAGMGMIVVGPAVDGEAAAQLARVGAPDMAILDIRMPKRDGLAVAAEIFGELAIPVIIVSAYSDEKATSDARAAGVFGYLIKPCGADQLRVAIEIAWQRYLDFMRTSTERDDYRRRLDERRVIEQAKWIVIEKQKITEPEAMRALQRQARDSRQKLFDICVAIVAQSEGRDAGA